MLRYINTKEFSFLYHLIFIISYLIYLIKFHFTFFDCLFYIFRFSIYMIAYIFKSFQAHDQISGGDYCSTNQDKKGPTYGKIIIVVILDY